MSAADEGRTEDATARQKSKFRNDGNVPKSMEINSAVQFLIGYTVLLVFGGLMVSQLAELSAFTFANAGRLTPESGYQGAAQIYVFRVIVSLLPLFVALFLSVFAVNVAQFGFKITTKPIKPKLSKVNPFTNFKKVLISKNQVFEVIKNITKMLVMSMLAWTAIAPLVGEFPNLYQLTAIQVGIVLWNYVKAIWLYFIFFMVALGIIDAIYQRRQHNDQMKMTKDQVKDEQKQMYGDLNVKRKIRQKGAQLLRELMLQNTEQADVVITNPTHVAVALKYEHGKMAAPVVIAKGVDHLALMIRKRAREKQVPIVENRALARALFKFGEVGKPIPDAYFRPVAEILAFLYKLNRERAAS